MKKDSFSASLRTCLFPALVMLLGLVLMIDPDSASALIARILGWVLLITALGSAVKWLSWDRRPLALVSAVVPGLLGLWLLGDPLRLAAFLGRIVGLILLLNGLQDMGQVRSRLFSTLCVVLGLVLILLPMTVSRLVFSLVGLAVLLTGGAMLLSRLKGHSRLDPPGDGGIVDAL